MGGACPIASVIGFVLEMAMRWGELAEMRWAHLDRDKRMLRVPEAKDDAPRNVPLSTHAMQILNALPLAH